MQISSPLLRDVLDGEWDKVRKVVNSGTNIVSAENEAMAELQSILNGSSGDACNRTVVATRDAQHGNNVDSPPFCAANFGLDRLAGLLIRSGWPESIHVAAMLGDTEAIARMVKNGADLEERASWGETPLLLACWRSKLETIYTLIRLGADANAASHFSTVLITAAASGNVKAVSMLISHGADVNKETDFGGPLHAAAKAGSAGVVELLLDKGADINRETLACYPPLVCAATLGRESVVPLLLDRGADPVQVDKGGATALERALDKGHLRVARIIKERLDRDRR